MKSPTLAKILFVSVKLLGILAAHRTAETCRDRINKDEIGSLQPGRFVVCDFGRRRQRFASIGQHDTPRPNPSHMQPDRGRTGAAIESKRHGPRRGVIDPVEHISNEEDLSLGFPFGRIELVLRTLFADSLPGSFLRLSFLFGISNQKVTCDRLVIERFTTGQVTECSVTTGGEALIFALLRFFLRTCGLLFWASPVCLMSGGAPTEIVATRVDNSKKRKESNIGIGLFNEADSALETSSLPILSLPALHLPREFSRALCLPDLRAKDATKVSWRSIGRTEQHNE